MLISKRIKTQPATKELRMFLIELHGYEQNEAQMMIPEIAESFKDAGYNSEIVVVSVSIISESLDGRTKFFIRLVSTQASLEARASDAATRLRAMYKIPVLAMAMEVITL